jgi:hypothetical protein
MVGRWTLGLYGKNLGDAKYLVRALNAATDTGTASSSPFSATSWASMADSGVTAWALARPA